LAATIHQVKVTLRDVKPAVWRRIVVPSNFVLGDLAVSLLGAMGWSNSHLHAFRVGRASYGPVDEELDDLGLDDEDKILVGKALPKVGSKLRFEYDFGDGWEHDVIVEEIGPRRPRTAYPLCTEGKRACPPEDCGGPGGYAEILELLVDPARPDPEDIRGWIEPDFDPAHFDPAKATKEMQTYFK
jgi:hypothetical protein